MTSTSIICDHSDIRVSMIHLFEQEWSISPTIAANVYDNALQEHIKKLKPTAHFVIETLYVDRVYRDSYYNYFATKLGVYKKDCIRLSFFDGPLTPQDFKDPQAITTLQNRYWGFMVLRPTIPQIVGRSVIHPSAIQGNTFLCVTSQYPASVNSIKLTATGFPHSSQDAETITCAETTIWSMMEYFSCKYPEYKPALPSAIIKALRSRTNVRQIPSEGLQVDQMCYAMLEFGFATKLYSKQNFKPVPFRRLFSTYVESGLPLLVTLDNNQDIGHALLVIGRAPTSADQIRRLQIAVEPNQYLNNLLVTKNIQLFDNDDINRDFVFIDDNMPVYQLQNFDTPALHYPSPNWHTCEIDHFIVPMHPKMYLEAVEAKSYIKHLLLDGTYNVPNGSDIFLRVYLTSSRSYKDYLAKETSFNVDFQDFILETPMPKFIWVGEISNKSDIIASKAHGLFILDATEPNLENYQALIVGGYIDKFCYPDHTTKKLQMNALPLGSFKIYTNNLKGF